MAGVFGNLFETEETVGSDDFDSVSSTAKSNGLELPPRPRASCQLSGINNQGATCYLNSLLQTLLFTPEFRDRLFSLGPQELGRLEDCNKPGSKVRVIPIQLQRLFSRLLLLNTQSVSTIELTESFGWNNNEQFQQHDVQELNRILFSAIESSFVGTSGHDLIQSLYHGKIVNQIKCLSCEYTSECEEVFLDLPVTVAGSTSLDQSLNAAYQEVEMLVGPNQYRCSRCNKLVDATKGARIRSLPSILTVSLLRFSFNFHTAERYKETGRFTFPTALNMGPYSDQVGDGGKEEYELFSVVIHSGGAHGGHYHAYIRDIDSLGDWVPPEEEEILVPKDLTGGSQDLVEIDSPLELVQLLLSWEKNKGMTVEKLGQEMLKQTGRSWNKRFKSRHGTMSKFLSSHSDKFIFDPASKHVSLKMDAKNQPIAESPNCCTCNHGNQDGSNINKTADGKTETDRSCNDTCNKCGQQPAHTGHGDGTTRRGSAANKQKKPNPPEQGRAWFDFNDSRVHPIYEKDLEKQFSGRESAYMLFYRRKSLTRPSKAEGNKKFEMRESLIEEVQIENEILDKQREAYEVAVNSLTLTVHFSSCYQYREGALKLRPGVNDWKQLTIDQRQSTLDLYGAVREIGEDKLPCEDFQINKYKELPAGGHLYDIIPEADDLTLKTLDVQDGSKLFVWDGQMVEGQIVPMGPDSVPLFLTVIYGEGLQFSQGYSRSLMLEEMIVVICEIIRIKGSDMKLKRLIGKGSELRLIPLFSTEMKQTLAEIGLQDGDQLLAEDKSANGFKLTEEEVSKTLYSNKLVIHVENRCGQQTQGGHEYQTDRLEVEKTMYVGELKAMMTTKFALLSVAEGGRLRIDHDSLGLRQPLCDDISLFEAGVSQGTRLVLEAGPAPKSDEMTLFFTSDRNTDYQEVIVKRGTTVEECVQFVLSKANITDDAWHLRKTNWCGEAAELLDDPEQTLEASLVNDGDVLLLEPGRLPPKGFIRLPIWLHSTPQSVRASSQQEGGLMCWMSSIYNLIGKSPDTASRSGEVSSKASPVFLGEVEISKETTLDDLKQQVLTLNMVSDLPIPSPDFMRLRLIENDTLTTILRDKKLTLKRLRLSSNSVLALQILPEEENLSVNQIVLNVCQRIPDSQRYNPAIELIWDINSGATIPSLRKAVSEVLFIEPQQLCMAKHFPQRYEWMMLKIHNKNNGSGKKGNAGKNIRQGPFHIRDGDTIGVKDLLYDPNDLDTFMTAEDVVGQHRLQKEMEEKRKQRDERKKMAGELGPINKPVRREVGIHIKVDDFR